MPVRTGLRSMEENGCVLVSDFDYHLPEELIAKQPLADRAASRLLHVDREPDVLEDRQFRDFPELAAARRSAGLQQYEGVAGAAVRTSQRLARAAAVAAESGRQGFSARQGRGAADETAFRFADGVGGAGASRPQARRSASEFISAARRTKRRTNWRPRSSGAGRSASGICASIRSTISSPCSTASATFRCRRTSIVPIRLKIASSIRRSTPSRPARSPRPRRVCTSRREILERIRQRGIETAEVTLHVGLGTFQPVREEVVEEHKLHTRVV